MERVLQSDREELGSSVAIPELRGFSVEQKVVVEHCYQAVSSMVIKAVGPEIAAGLIPAIEFGAERPETDQRYGIETLAQANPDGPLIIFEGFFKKKEVEQQYILAHEFGHYLTGGLFRDSEHFQRLNEMVKRADLNGETRYVRHVMQQRAEGKLSDEAVLAEQTAERLAAYLLAQGDLVATIEIQALYMERPDLLFEGIPSDVLADRAKLSIYLSSTESLNPLLQDAVDFHQLVKQSLENIEKEDDDEYGDVWNLPALDDTSLGSSSFLDTYMGQQNQANKPQQDIWGFLRDLFTLGTNGKS